MAKFQGVEWRPDGPFQPTQDLETMSSINQKVVMNISSKDGYLHWVQSLGYSGLSKHPKIGS